MIGKQLISLGARKRGMAMVSNIFVYSIGENDFLFGYPIPSLILCVLMTVGICILLGKHTSFWNLGNMITTSILDQEKERFI